MKKFKFLVLTGGTTILFLVLFNIGFVFASTYSFESVSDYTVLKKQVNDPTGWKTCEERSNEYPSTPAVKDTSGQFYVGSECDSVLPNLNRVWRHYVSFNTSSIPDGETVTAAKFCASVNDTTVEWISSCRTYIDFEVWSGSWTAGFPSWDSGNTYEGIIFPNVDDVPPFHPNEPHALNISPSTVSKTGQTQLRLNVDDETFCEGDDLFDISDYVKVLGPIKLLVGTNGSAPGSCPGEAGPCGTCIPIGCGFVAFGPEPEQKIAYSSSNNERGQMLLANMAQGGFATTQAENRASTNSWATGLELTFFRAKLMLASVVEQITRPLFNLLSILH